MRLYGGSDDDLIGDENEKADLGLDSFTGAEENVFKAELEVAIFCILSSTV